jgi:alpha-D-xyloside xylohydrolase
MKNHLQFIVLIALYFFWVNVLAQTDFTNKITNPGFETGNLTGWTWAGANGYAWLGPNTDGDNTKNGSYIGGIWNASIGDCELSQTITGLAPGYYQVRCLMTVSHNRDKLLTTQRLFAQSGGTVISQLYGGEAEAAYSQANLAVLAGTESYTFAGHETSQAENGPFKEVAIVKHVTDGSLKIGIRVNGKSSALGYGFAYTTRGDAGFFKFDHFRLFEVSSVATLDNIILSEGVLNEPFAPNNTVYTATLPVGTKSVTPKITASAEGAEITGDGVVDVSSGSGTSTISVRSIDGTKTMIYTINYTVLTQAPETIVSYEADATGVSFTLVTGSMRARVCNDNIIRISYCKQASLPKGDTLIVNKIWELPSFIVGETDTAVTITTSTLNIVVAKANSKVSYYDKSGNLIVSESSKSVEPITYSQYALNTNICAATFNSPIDEALYGLGQHQQGVMNFKGQIQSLDQQNGEIALPFLVTNKGYGILWDNYSKSEFNGKLSSNTMYSFTSESGDMVDYYFMYGPTMDGVISAYRTASGKAPLFPKWAYGLFQSKDKYSTADELLKMGNAYRNAKIPLDVIVQDWDYWTPDVWGSNTVNSTRYPDPKATVDSLHNMNLHSMISIWPVFHKNSANYQEYNSIGALYPSAGDHHFYDPHNADAREIYWNQVNTQLFSKYGWDSWWADNNEPQGWPDAFDRKNFTTALGSGVTYYNSYPIAHVSGFYKGWRRDIPNKRVFILSRSSFPGQQRYGAASWSGDIHSNWTDFQNQLSGGLNFSLSGIPYWTTDIGGYWITDWSTADNNELMVRWFQYGTFCPLYRIHGKGDKSMVSTQNLTNNTIQSMVKFDKLRYRLMPYIYSLGWKVTNENYTIMRHLIMEYQDDVKVKNIEDQFFFGPYMMINPIASLGQRNRDIYLPAGDWYDFWTGEKIEGNKTINVDVPLDNMPIYIKAGSIVPMGPEIQYTDEKIDPIEIRVYRGADGQFTIYEDAGDTYNYEMGEHSVIPLTYIDGLQQLTIGARNGSFPTMATNRTFKVVWVDAQYGVGINTPVVCDTTVAYDGSEVIVKYNPLFTKPILKYEAEDATLSGSAIASVNHKYFSGIGYVEGMNSFSSNVLFTVEAPKSGIYQIKLRYTLGAVAKRNMLTMSANDVEINTLKLNATRDLNTWGDAFFYAPLAAGTNTLKFGGDSTSVVLDCIELNATSSTSYFQTSSKTYRIRPLNKNLYLSVFNDGLQLAAIESTKNQMWEIEKTGENTFKLTSLDNGKSVIVNQALTSAGASITVGDYNASPGQQWYIECIGSDGYFLTASHSNLVMGIGSGNVIEQQTDIDAGSQRWIFEEVTSSEAKIALYEPFNYNLNQPLNNLGVAGNGWGGPWSVFEGTSANMLIDTPIAYSGLATNGNRLKATLSSAEGLRASRTIEPRFEDTGDDIWLSFLLQIDNPAFLANSWQGISLYSGSDERVLIGKDWGLSQLGIVGYGVGSALSQTSAFSGNQNWLVVKIETSGDASNENAYLWINPDPSTEPNISSADLINPVKLNTGFDKIVCHLGNTAGISSSFDEIRLGYSFNQVSIPNVGTAIKPLEANGDYCNIYFNRNEKRLIITSGYDTPGEAQLKILSMNGICCFAKTIKVAKGFQCQSIDLNNQEIVPGIYIVSFIKDSKKYSQKIIL